MSILHDKGNPPPKISSREGIPVEVMVVEDEVGHGRVPEYEGSVGDFAEPFLLKEDMSRGLLPNL